MPFFSTIKNKTFDTQTFAKFANTYMYHTCQNINLFHADCLRMPS